MKLLNSSRLALNSLFCIVLLYILWSYDSHIFSSNSIRAKNCSTTESLNYCSGPNYNSCVKPFIAFKQRYRVASKYKLVGCAIDKNFSTMLTAILCFLHNELKYRKSKRKLVNEIFQRRFCGSKNEYSWLHDITATFNITTNIQWKAWSWLVIVRDPFKRFVSGFTDKCLIEQTWKKYPDRCNGCKRNLTCFMERQYDRMIRKSNNQKISANFDDDHFHPQNWRCEFYSHFHHYNIIHYDSEDPTQFFEVFYEELNKKDVSTDALNFIKESLSSNRTSHSTVDLPERHEVARAIRENTYHMQLLIKMYYYDFILFGYSIPNL